MFEGSILFTKNINIPEK